MRAITNSRKAEEPAMDDQNRPHKTGIQWYALYCRSRHERMVHARLQEKGYDSYLADYGTRMKHGIRLRIMQKNLLPGYVLINAAMTPKVYLDVLQTKSVVHFVGRTWPDLSWIPVDQVESLKLLLHSQQRFEEISYCTQGDTVEVIAGPLAGLRGLFAGEAYRKDHVIVSLDLLQRSLAVEINPSLLRRLPASGAFVAHADSGKQEATPALTACGPGRK